jgi:hypothetical protein
MSEQNENNVDFKVYFMSEKSDDDTVIITSFDDIYKDVLKRAISNYDSKNQQFSAYLKDDGTPLNYVTLEYLDELSESPQTDIDKILKINSIIRKYINKDDIIGKTVETIGSNVNSTFKLSYPDFTDEESTIKIYEKAKKIINDFNEQINIKQLISNSISTTYAEGTYIMYLRKNEENNYIVDYYPIGVAEVDDYNINGNPAILFNIQKLKQRLNKIYKKNRKNKALYFNDMDEEVKANYPKEVYKAYKNNEFYAKMDINYTGVLRIGNLNRKYGLSPIFRALKPTIMLETFENADRVNSKAKAKKIIHQKLRKEVLGTDFSKSSYPEMIYAHETLMDAWKQPTVLVTTPATVESIAYVEPTTELTNVNTINSYRSKVLNTLGIGFLMDTSSQNVSTANISIAQLLRTVNKISEQLEIILHRWYRQVLVDNGIPVEYCPNVQIIDSEALEMSIKLELATFLYTTLGASLETCYETIGLDIQDETAKRKVEKKKGIVDVFTPYATSYNSNGDNNDEGNTPSNNGKKGGRTPSKQQTTKTVYDKARNKGLKQ